MTVRLVCDPHAEPIALDVLVAASPLQRMRGLIGLEMPPATALQLPGARQVHTFGLKRAIDVVFCDRGLEVLHVERRFPPRRISMWVKGARVVFELHAGAAGRIQPGDRLDLVTHGSDL